MRNFCGEVHTGRLHEGGDGGHRPCDVHKNIVVMDSFFVFISSEICL